MGDDNRDSQGNSRELILNISKLGFEVGYFGHLEGVGWVKQRLREIEEEAADLGLLEEVQEKYEMAKDLGKKRREKVNQTPGKNEAIKAPILDFEDLPNTMKLKPVSEASANVERSLRVT